MSKVFNFSKLILLCSKRIDLTKRIIQISEGGKAPIHLSLFIF